MEYNKDDALKAKELAEDKLLKKDYVGARIYAMKARELDPNLVDLPPLMAAIEVNISAERRVNGQVDWYGVLGAQPLSDDVTIRRCYKTRVLMLHPDKNKSAGALEAFKLVTQAWSLFSDKDQKINYDQNLISWGRYEEIPGGKPSVPARQNSFYNNNIFSTANCKDRDQMNATHPILTPVSPVTSKQTFWTRCRSCSIQLEYQTVYINCKIICFSCRQPLLAREEPPPPVYRNDSSTSIDSQMKQHDFSSTRIERNCHASGRNPMYAVNSSLESGRFSMPGGISSVPTPTFAVSSSLESGHFSMPGGISSVLTPMFAVSSSLESGHFSMPGGISSVLTPMFAVSSSLESGHFSMPGGISSVLTPMFAVSSSLESGHFSMPGGISSVLTPMFAVSSSLESGHFSMPGGISSVLTPMFAVSSSLESGHFSMPGGISSVLTPMFAVSSSLESGHFSMPGGISSVLTPMFAVSSSLESGHFSMPGGISSVLTPMFAVSSSLESGHFSMPGGISSVLTPMFAVSSSLESGHFSMPGGISSVLTPMFAVSSSLESGHFSMPGGISSVLTPMFAVSSSLESGHFSMPGGISSVLTPMFAVSSSLESGHFSMPGGISSVLTPMFAVSSSLESGHFSMPGGISSVPTSMFAVNSSRESGLFSMPGRYEDIPGLKPSVPACQNVFCNNSGGTHPIPTSVSPVLLKQTFWTRCDSCGTQFEYRTTYINCKLICASCRQPFLAHEAPPPSVSRNGSSTSRISEMNEHNFNSTRIERSCHASGRTPMYANPSLGSGHFSMPGGISAVPTSASTAAEASGVYGMLSENLKRQREDSTPIIREEHHFGKTHAVVRDASASPFKSSCFAPDSVLIGDSSRKIRRTDGNQVHGDGRDMETKIAYEKGGIRLLSELRSQKDSLDTGSINASGVYKDNGNQELSRVQLRNILMEKTRKNIHKKLGELRSSPLSRILAKPNNTIVGDRARNKERAVSGVKRAAPIGNKCYSADSEVTENLTMSVPDPDFHDFDRDRTENAFGDNQIWASYDNDDGMPRFYAFVYNVIPNEHFKVRISWLSSKTNDELAPIKWVGAGFAKTVGDLRIGKHDVFSTTLNSFSHRVKWTKGSRGLIHIYPMKGDVWALYRNWSVEWNEFTKDEIVHKYDMVEVLDDYSEEQGVNVALLDKVAGFKTVFRRNEDRRKIMNIPKAEMFRFSHQVPSYLLTGQEGPNAPTGCLELDPAATPNELLQKSIEAPEEEMTIEKTSEEEPMPNVTFTEAAVEDVPRKEVAGSK
ncbi:hypothetical protein TanjilG_29352 [Lupinus angustifolius]|uniref:J domain-containing protein n=1 Tax=Lupinus angustifolius TaxID=3871 RepID=A0A1J7GS50_LUPAN|nr:PREDICTED: uncharacterized protein LOC109358617 [Lupinus angustifolius]XP_019458494.1 PREDICTED: uncharacterized protein LOC109358617 [Lupinus angustifolius]XP_019458495.1 PREDICTED: uncharacterized protein LOC109358617 [Lupinus angustifolius]OIW03367.1 hypothetical protein TanjilG_29352 [Lupinus angustifolius]